MTDILDTPPTYKCPTTRVWTLSALKSEPGSCTLGQWYVHAPWMHLAWHSYICSLIYLRDVEGASPATLNFPEATHEFIVCALDSKYKFREGEPAHYLTPPNIVKHFKRDSDALALESVDKQMTLVGEGSLSLDSDFSEYWERAL